MIRALIFDFDGLILETELPDLLAWQKVYREYGCRLSLSKWLTVIGGHETPFDPAADIEEQLGRPVDREAIRARHDEHGAELIAGLPVRPGVEDVIADARRLGLKLAVASSSKRAWVGGQLERLGLLRHFAVIKTGEDVERVKPDPALFLAALDALGVGPDEAIVFEDSAHGITGAKAAGIFCVAVPNDLTRRLDLSHADMRLDSLADVTLEELLAQVDGCDGR
jgi:HAD superfamily hydrolase (TIGR01509 family)